MKSPDVQWVDINEFEVQRVRQEKLHRLRSCWELPCVVLFFSFWKSSLNVLAAFETNCKSIEEALLDENDLLLAEMHVKLLRSILKRNDITYNSSIGGVPTARVWYDVLLGIVKEYGDNSPLLEVMEEAFTITDGTNSDRDATKNAYDNLAIELRVQLLYMLCNVSLGASDVFAEYVAEKETDADALRLQVVGVDSERSTYYYMNDSRLYMEYSYVERKIKKSVAKPRGRPKNKERVVFQPRLTERQMAKQQKMEESLKTKAPPSGRGTKRKAQQPVKSTSKIQVEEDVDIEPKENLPEFPYFIKRKQYCWRAVCVTSKEWKNLIARLSKSRHKVERELAETIKTLAETVVPSLERAELAAEKARTLDALPRRSSSRVKTNEQMSERDKRIHFLKREEERLRTIAEKEKEEIKKAKRQAAEAERERELAAREAKNEEAQRRRVAQKEKQRRAKEREIRLKDREATLEQERLEEEAIAAEREERLLLRTMPEEERIQYLASKEERTRKASSIPSYPSSKKLRVQGETATSRTSRTSKVKPTPLPTENDRESEKASRRILVFSSAFANEAASAVVKKEYKDVGDYHKFYQAACRNGKAKIVLDAGGAC
ncbi:hypothetical protein SARC_00040 [Sphaeroforma arctica JP610]|uniref:DDT domain-containing protein n=1 Tax=Sphaeroforma arctica JP610 TaxID=667725 RepID=A0A0L0GFH7_9EUKA|nr:hypothetical protein SARC_00040 [Sphaeroforma arctica JP610]KNC87782.1 hypothetical protein SARC_00040 [Sphaeroforma arctica JP610]|eukprot:XP_014161684.1 hypothetical protein SARC_00040 [Sphaeroforma arctica JP610]